LDDNDDGSDDGKDADDVSWAIWCVENDWVRVCSKVT